MALVSALCQMYVMSRYLRPVVEICFMSNVCDVSLSQASNRDLEYPLWGGLFT